MCSVNIVLITYNRPFFLNEAIQSILNQSYKKFNLIILDNGSDDTTKEYLKTLKDKRISVFSNKINTRKFINKAFSYTNNKYLMLAHDDDILEKDFLKYQIKYLELNNKIDLLACRINLIDENSKLLKRIRPRILKDKIWTGEQYIKHYSISGNIIPCPTIIYRSEFVNKFSLKYKWLVGPAVDLYLLFEANINGGIIALSKKPLYRYRIHSNQDSEKNRISLEFQVKPHIMKLLKESGSKYTKSFESGSNGIIINILLEGVFTKKYTCKEVIQYIKILNRDHNLKINKYSIYWACIGVLRGLKNILQ